MTSDVRDSEEQKKLPGQKLQIYPTSNKEISPFWRGLSLSLSHAHAHTHPTCFCTVTQIHISGSHRRTYSSILDVVDILSAM